MKWILFLSSSGGTTGPIHCISDPMSRAYLVSSLSREPLTCHITFCSGSLQCNHQCVWFQTGWRGVRWGVSQVPVWPALSPRLLLRLQMTAVLKNQSFVIVLFYFFLTLFFFSMFGKPDINSFLVTCLILVLESKRDDSSSGGGGQMRRDAPLWPCYCSIPRECSDTSPSLYILKCEFSASMQLDSFYSLHSLLF